jgi:hypothetical protein
MIDYIVIDTNTLPLDEDPRHLGKKTQVLLPPSEMGGGVVRVSYWPADFTEQIRRLIARGGHRHYHRSVNERHYVLGGDWTSLYWPADGRLVRARLHRHHYLENPPMALHGISRDFPPETGTKFLVWTSGAGTDIYEPAAKQESIDVEFEGPIPEHVRGSPVVFNAEDVAWQPHPEHSAWLFKPLSGSVPGQPAAALVNVPAGAHATFEVASPLPELKSWLFLLSGDLVVTATGARGRSEIGLKEGGFLAWSQAGRVSNPSGDISHGGCVALCVGHRLGPAARLAA